MDRPSWLADLFELTVVVDDGDPESLAYRESVVYERGEIVGRDRGQYRMEYLRVPPNVRLAAPPEVIEAAEVVATSAGTLLTVPVPPVLEGDPRAVTAVVPRVVFPEAGAGGVPTQVTFPTHLITSELDPEVVSTGIADPPTPHGFTPATCTAGRTEWNRDADGAYPAHLPHGLFRRWSDTLRDEGPVRVFRSHEEINQPARSRESFELRSDGVFVDFVLAPNDTVVPVAGRWKTTGPFTLEVGEFEDDAARPRTLELASYVGNELKIYAA